MAEKKLTRKEKRDQKFANRELKSFSGIYPYFRLLWSPRTAKVSWKFLHTVTKSYLGTQFLPYSNRKGRLSIRQKNSFYTVKSLHLYGFYQPFSAPSYNAHKTLWLKKSRANLQRVVQFSNKSIQRSKPDVPPLAFHNRAPPLQRKFSF